MADDIPYGRRNVWRLEMKRSTKDDPPEVLTVAADRCEIHAAFGLAFVVGDTVDSFFPYGSFQSVWRVSNGGEPLNVRVATARKTSVSG